MVDPGGQEAAEESWGGMERGKREGAGVGELGSCLRMGSEEAVECGLDWAAVDRIVNSAV